MSKGSVPAAAHAVRIGVVQTFLARCRAAGIGSLATEDDPTAEQVAERRLPGVRNLRLATRAEESVLRKRFHPILTDKPDGAA